MFATTAGWADLQVQLERASCAVQTASFSAAAVGIPTGKRRVSGVFGCIVTTRRQGSGLQACKMEGESGGSTTNDFLGRQGYFFLKGGKDENAYFRLAARH